MTQISPEILKALQEKYDAMGQDINGQLEGVLHANPINYWDYIQMVRLSFSLKTRPACT